MLIKVKDIYTNPKIDYLIHSGSLYKGTGLEKYLLKQKEISWTCRPAYHYGRKGSVAAGRTILSVYV